MDLQHLREWIGRVERRTDAVAVAPIAAMSATLDRDDAEPLPGDDVPNLWHWLNFTPRTPQSDIGVDGHAKLGGFLPPVPLPRRMWAGGRLVFEHPLQIGDEITRLSRIVSVELKEGRSGALVFVTVRHEITNARGLAIIEEQDIVYRDTPLPGAPVAAPQTAPSDAGFERHIVPDPVLLFRYSALTFNAHRIHYDRPYVTDVEGYPGLIVHGPLIATLLLDLLKRERPDAQIRRFEFKGVNPLFDLHPFAVCGRADDQRRFALWARNHEGQLAMRATAELI